MTEATKTPSEIIADLSRETVVTLSSRDAPHVLTVPKFLALADVAESLGQLVQARAMRAVAESMARDDLDGLADAVNAYRRGLDERKPLGARKEEHEQG